MTAELPPPKKTRAHFEGGLYCAESVLKTVAEVLGVESPLVPRMATALCSGMSRTGGTCGALSGAMLGLSLAHGRDQASGDVEWVYADTQDLVEAFEARFGATTCPALLGCHLGTPEGQKTFIENNLSQRCFDYAEGATELALKILNGEEV